MQSKKGIYLLIGFISAILIFFCILFFVHENALENGILFTVSFQYEGAKEIKYNFYNQSGKIEKIEGDNSFFLAKTDYNSVKLLRKITKKRKESKTPYNEKGIQIYNGQNKRYYLIPYEEEIAVELSSFIIDGYIHSELQKTTGKDYYQELYLYQNDKTKNWTKNGDQNKIIHTYSCQNKDCKFLYVGIENETILWDDKYYLYNYQNSYKEEIIIEEKNKNAKWIKLKNEIKGIEVTSQNDKKALYDLERKEYVSDFTDEQYTYITKDLYLKQKTTKKEDYYYTVTVTDKNTHKDLWKLDLEEKNKININMRKLTIQEIDYFVLEKIEENNKSYQLINSNGEWINKNLIQTKEGNYIINEKDLLLREKDYYRIYDSKGNFLEETEDIEKLELK